MSWSAKAKGNRHAIDGEARAMWHDAKEQADGHPPSMQAIKVHEAAFHEVLRVAPMRSFVALETSGHFNHDGTGEAVFTYTVAAEQPEVAPESAAAEASVTPTEALLEEHPPEAVAGQPDA